MSKSTSKRNKNPESRRHHKGPNHRLRATERLYDQADRWDRELRRGRNEKL